MNIKCVVSCRDSHGSPAFCPVVVQATKKEFDDGEHYQKAKERAEEFGYEDVGVVYDEHDGPDWLFDNLFGY